MINSKQVLDLLREGKNTREIADILNTRIENVQQHRHRLILKGQFKPKGEYKYNFDSMDEAIDFWIKRLQDAKRVPLLESKITQLEARIAELEKQLVETSHQDKLLRDKAIEYKKALNFPQ